MREVFLSGGDPSFFLTAGWQALSLTSYQLTKQTSSFSRKLCFVCKLTQTPPFTTMRPRRAAENKYNTQHLMNVDKLLMCLRVNVLHPRKKKKKSP